MGRKRFEFPKDIDWSQTLSQLSNDLGCSIPTLRREFHRRFNRRKDGSGGHLKPKVRNWDWSKSDIELALRHGISRQRVHKLRKTLGK